MVFGDLRGWIEALKEAGEIHEIDAEVNWDRELGAITRRVFGNGNGPAVLFNNITDYQNGRCQRLFTGGLSNFSRIAMMFGLPKDATIASIVKAARDAFASKVEPVIVDSGPVKENILTGDDIDLYEFPAPQWHPKDGGRYINTFQGTVTKDPDTGVENVGLYRGMIGSKNTLPVLIIRPQNWGSHLTKHEAAGTDMPVAFVYGWEPSLPFAASAPIAAGVCEYEVMGAIRGAPVELVKCETVDLMVPASAELVIEGFIPTDPSTFEMEGPFGEYTGYMGGERGLKHSTRVTCISHRNDPIFRGTLEGNLPGMVCEDSIMCSIQRAAAAWNVLDRAGVPGITDVHCPAANNGLTLIIQMKQTYRGQAKQAAMAIWGSSAAHLRYKHVWVVDEDIDIHDYGALDWAFAYRVNAAEDDILFFPGTFGSPLDPSTRLEYRDVQKFGTGKWCRVLIDATINLDFEPQEAYGGERYPPSVQLDPADIALVEKRWKDYGFD
ncbi:MAG: UbiD family decarboxylase [Rhodospirillaceae bacterium]|jgi:UbiD family decarboxylase|nr:UbiD family decarboxylase [Rhodospirillaceae bacterium]